MRAEVVPKKPVKKGVQLPLFARGDAGHLEPPPEPSRHPWPWLLKRVFAVDITVCPKCTGRMRVIEVAKDEDAAARVLSELGIARAPPPTPRHIDPRQLSLSFRRLSNFSPRAEGHLRQDSDVQPRILTFLSLSRLIPLE